MAKKVSGPTKMEASNDQATPAQALAEALKGLDRDLILARATGVLALAELILEDRIPEEVSDGMDEVIHEASLPALLEISALVDEWANDQTKPHAYTPDQAEAFMMGHVVAITTITALTRDENLILRHS
jgi:hypothetical protein